MAFQETSIYSWDFVVMTEEMLYDKYEEKQYA